MTWTPTAENINALPEGLRDYIHRLEANTDPAGMVRENVLLRERVAQLEVLLAAVRELATDWDRRVEAVMREFSASKLDGVRTMQRCAASLRKTLDEVG